MRDSTSKPGIDQLNAMRACGLPRKRAIAAPKPAHITTDAKHAPASTLAITEVCDSTSPPTVVNVVSAPSVVTQPLGLTHVKRTASTKLMGLPRPESAPPPSPPAIPPAT